MVLTGSLIKVFFHKLCLAETICKPANPAHVKGFKIVGHQPVSVERDKS